LVPAIGTFGFFVALVMFLRAMPRGQAIATAALILAVAAWNIAQPSLWSIFSAMAIILWMMYALKKEDFRKEGIVSGRPLPKKAKWIFIFIVVEAAAGIAHSYFTYVTP
jgi:hypothetical protein